MPSWSVIVWAVVTPDLEDALKADLKEAGMALRQLPTGWDIHVHVNIVRGFDGSTTISPRSMTPPSTLCGHSVRTIRMMSRPTPISMACCPPPNAGRRPTSGSSSCGVMANGPFPTLSGRAGVPGAAEVVDFLGGHRSPDIIGYDACWMATLRTVITLANTMTTGVFIGSMVPEPVSGWPYAELIRILCGPGDPKAVAAAVVQAYDASLSAPDRRWSLWIWLPCAEADDGLASRPWTNLVSTAAPDRVSFFAAADGADILEDTISPT